MGILLDSSAVLRLKKEYGEFYHYKNPDGFFKKHKDTFILLEGLLKENPWFKNIKLLFRGIANNIFDACHCEGCGAELSVERVFGKKEIYHYCSAKCAYGSKSSKQKRRITCLERYGVDCVSKSNEVCDKIKKTNLERYGCEHVLQNKAFKDKARKTCLERYGHESAFQNSSIKKKAKDTTIERYGVEYAMQNKEIHLKQENTMLEKYGDKHALCVDEFNKKRRETTLERYGVEYASQNEDVKKFSEEKKRHAVLDKYGVENVFQLESVKEKSKKTNFERYGSENPAYSDTLQKKKMITNYYRLCERLKDYVVPLFTEEEYRGWKNENYGTKYRWKCVKCGCEFSDHLHTVGFADNMYYVPRCPHCFPKDSGFSYEEKEFVSFLKEICHHKIIENSREIIPPLEIDAYIPEYHVAFEFDGLYWHSEEAVGSGYHLYKTDECAKRGVRLIHVFEDEWMRHKDVVKDRIRSIFGVEQKRIHARKCAVKEISSLECNKFLDINHLQGHDNAKYCYGLYHSDGLVAVMTFGKPRFNRNYDYELIRYCSKIGFHVAGGAGKLLSFFQNSHNGSIISYADRRYSIGNLYEKIGFVNKGMTKPNYFWVNGMKKYSRYQCQKHKLAKLLGDKFDAGMSETENMIKNGYCRIYDCGNIVYCIE